MKNTVEYYEHMVDMNRYKCGYSMQAVAVVVWFMCTVTIRNVSVVTSYLQIHLR